MKKVLNAAAAFVCVFLAIAIIRYILTLLYLQSTLVDMTGLVKLITFNVVLSIAVILLLVRWAYDCCMSIARDWK